MQHDLRRHLRAYLSKTSGDFDIAVTLTLKQQDGPTKLDQMEASKNFRHFMNRLNQKAYGNAARRFGKRIEVVPMLEVSYAGRLHYHLAMRNPFPDLATCNAAVLSCWMKTRWGYNEIDVQPLHSFGWIGYITKSRNIDGWDVENTHLTR